MARSYFGGTAADWLLRSWQFGTRPVLTLSVGTTTLTFWSAATGGSPYEDLLDAAGSPATQITVQGHQVPRFRGPDGVVAMWADKGDGTARELMEAQDLAGAAALAAEVETARAAVMATQPAGTPAPLTLPYRNAANTLIWASATSVADAALGGRASTVVVDSDFATFAAALAATPAGGVLEVRRSYSVSTPLVIDKPCVVRFAQGGQITASAGHGIVITASGVTLERARILGSGSGTAGTACGIRAIGAASAPITGLRLIQPTVSGMDRCGIHLEHVTDFALEWAAVSDIAYAGIMLLSCVNGKISGGSVTNITQPTGFVNSYGIAVTRNSAQSVTDAPRSSRITIDGVLVSGVTAWEGIDTHGGTDLAILANRIYSCRVGIALVPSADEFGADVYAPQRCLVAGNTVDAQVSDGSRSNGVQVVGAGAAIGAAVEAASGCVVVNNTIIDHGNQGSASSNEAGAILAYYTQGLIVASNTLVRPGVCGVHLYHTNSGLLLAGNVIEDAWTNAAALTACVYVRSSSNSFTTSNTRIVRGAKTATVVNGRGLSVSTTTSNDIADSGGNNWSAATLATSGASTLMRYRVDAPLVGFFSAPPVAKPTVTGSRGGNAAVASLIAALAGLGLITDSTTA